ncbi:MAG: aminoacyl-histidine dipeptidase [Prevotella sp.]|nr:aminoacyl-histidine dipeptidase [Bacteroidales bacterium]MDD6896852.1 aminoacyl-histidine dipeptidase [Bacteroidales bacterium]MDY2692447.1 aminoacyl-histidine dipeptidase [Prevotella sp.]MDY4731818.1 aminoacyl-histidine dipeptidase [Prevotella sp.]MDY6027004.1 aminoacyl-histidine dipeptidase [Prevotella sp.]
MSEIKNLKPECIWRNFDALTQVPRPSGHLEKVQQFLLDFAKRAGVEAYKDEAENIVMRKPATPGMENRKTTILQAHMDMVPQKDKDSTHDFVNDPIQTYIDGDWVRAKGTTLGADNGLGVAAIMAIMEATDLKHGPLEALITADEETGMFGANALPEGKLEGEILLNLDTEEDDELIIGSAGGVDITATLDYKSVESDKEDVAVKVVIKGLKGGHSGLEICEGRGNANKMMARIVRDAIADDDACLATWHGGNMRNAIPREAEVVLTLPKENKEDLVALVAEYKTIFNDEFKGIENEITVLVEDVDLPAEVVPEEIQDNLVDAIYAAHNGVWRYIPSIPNIVETSSNLAIVDIEGGKAAVKILARSSSESVKEEISRSLESCFNMAGMKVEFSGEYGGWNPNTESELIKVMQGLYKELFNEEPKVQVVHAGLECSIILSKYPGLDICSFGPTLRSPHTPNERAYWPSAAKFWALLTRTLEEIPVK